LEPEDRKKLLLEMSRLSNNLVIFHDYGTKKSLKISFIEWLEKEDYLDFIKNPIKEMQKIFKSIEIWKASKYYNWYICQK
jgi:hypothetical protein